MSTKRQIQKTGTRRWWGTQLQAFQDNIYTHLEDLILAHLLTIDPVAMIIKYPTFDTNHKVTETGYILIPDDTGSYKICMIPKDKVYSGTSTTPFYLKQGFESEVDTYVESGTEKEINRYYIAEDTTVGVTPHIKVDLGSASMYKNEAGTVLGNLYERLKDTFYPTWEADNHLNNSIDASFIQGEMNEEWTQVTLEAGFEHHSTYPLKYRKNACGNLELKGTIKRTGAGLLIVTLPVGYQPNYFQTIIAKDSIYGNLVILTVATTGAIQQDLGHELPQGDAFDLTGTIILT